MTIKAKELRTYPVFVLMIVLCIINTDYAYPTGFRENCSFKMVTGKIYSQLNTTKQPSPDYLYKNMQVDSAKHILYGVEYGATMHNKQAIETFRHYAVDLSDIRFIYPECDDTKPYHHYIAIETKNRQTGKDWKFRFKVDEPIYNSVETNTMHDLKLLCQLCGSNPTIIQTDALKRDLKAKVATIVETEIRIDSSGKDANRITKTATKTSFTRNGNLIEESDLDSVYHLTGRTTYLWNFRGQLTEESTFYFDGKLASKHSYNYDSQGNLTSETIYSKKENKSEPPTKKIYYKYQEKGDTLTTNQFDEDNFLLFKSVTITNDSLSETTEYKYNRDDDLFIKYSFKYDLKGNLIESAYYAADGTLDMKDSYTYQSRLLIERDSYYNPRMRLELPAKHKYTYYEDENHGEELEYDNAGKLSTTYSLSYEYDNAGNWTRQTTKKNDQIYTVKERKITYF